MTSSTSNTALRAHILDIQSKRLDKQNQQKNTQDTWWLLGTAGCHLCEDAEQVLKQLSAVYPIEYQYIDIIDFDEEVMMDLASCIPVLITPTARLDWPFSVMDVQGILK